MVRCRVVVRGRVQGVFFRDSCRRQAELLGLSGAVWNRSDGSVELEAEGDEPAVAALVEWCRHGPPRADVSSVDVVHLEPTGRAGFRILPGPPAR